MNGEYWYKYIKEHKPDVLGKDIIDYVEQLKLDKQALEKELNLHVVGCSLPSKIAIVIEAERRNPYKKHLVDFNNGMHEGFIDGAYFVLEAIKNNK